MHVKGLPQSFSEVSRREFLAAGSASVVGLPLRDSLLTQGTKKGAVVQILLTGGASHLETFDPKPHAPREIRGPLHSIATRIPGVRFSECFPRLAERANRLTILRSLYHSAAPIHETGLQLLQRGELAGRRSSAPQLGFVLQDSLRPRRKAPVSVQLGGALSAAGAAGDCGDGPGRARPQGPLPGLSDLPAPLSAAANFAQAPRRAKEAYGETLFGSLLWSAARLVERGVQYVAVNTFNRLEGKITWDAHGCPQAGPATIFDYRDTLGPQFDRALAAFLDDLQHCGLWRQTLVVCAGEMGRAPRLNAQGGRDHWTQAWSGLLAGGMLAGGQVIGETDEHGESILADPIDLAQLPALMLDFLGAAPAAQTELAYRVQPTATPRRGEVSA
jgi:hypothetical protein